MNIRERFFDALSVAAAIASVVTAVVVFRTRAEGRSIENSQPKPIAVANWERLVGSGRLVGSRNAPLKIVEFADFQCPACRALHGIFQKLASDNPGQFAVSFHYAPLRYHPMAYPAARAAECAADQGKFAAYHDLLFAAFDSLRSSSFPVLAQRAGIPDLAKFKRCVQATDSVPRINADYALAFDSLSIQGTPATIVDGKLYAFAPTLSELTRMIKEAH